jgi:hypothetical protein
VAVLSASPEWTQSLLLDPNTHTSYLDPKYAGLSPMTDTLDVVLFNPHTYKPQVMQASIANRSQTEDFGMKGYWWNDALTQGLLNLGRDVDVLGVDGTFNADTGSASQPLAVLTGYPVQEKLFAEYALSDSGGGGGLWADLSRAPKTPVVFTTISEPTKTEPEIGDNHAYPVLRTEEDAEGRWVVARNVWGRTDRFKFDDVKANGWLVAHLKEWNELERETIEKRVKDAVGGTKP